MLRHHPPFCLPPYFCVDSPFHRCSPLYNNENFLFPSQLLARHICQYRGTNEEFYPGSLFCLCKNIYLLFTTGSLSPISPLPIFPSLGTFVCTIIHSCNFSSFMQYSQNTGRMSAPNKWLSAIFLSEIQKQLVVLMEVSLLK